jgi:hypothetical protein
MAVACGAIALAAVAADSAKAANAWGGSYCMSDREGRLDCGSTTLAQCWASASGTDAGCYEAPRALLQPQSAFAAVGTGPAAPCALTGILPATRLFADAPSFPQPTQARETWHRIHMSHHSLCNS